MDERLKDNQAAETGCQGILDEGGRTWEDRIAGGRTEQYSAQEPNAAQGLNSDRGTNLAQGGNPVQGQNAGWGQSAGQGQNAGWEQNTGQGQYQGWFQGGEPNWYPAMENSGMVQPEQENHMALASMIMGILSIISACCFSASFILGGLAVMFAALSRVEEKMSRKGKTGLITGIIGIAAGLVSVGIWSL